jgi:hypothetical protein
MKLNPTQGMMVATMSKVEVLTIASGASLSDVLDCRGFRISAIEIPSAWTAASVTFVHGMTSSGTFQKLSADADEVVEQASASETMAVKSNAVSLSGLAFVKLRSGTAASPIAQGATRTINVHLVAAA